MEFINYYLERGFGTMNKNDVEVYVFNELTKDPKYVGFTDYQFSRELRIPQAKVKRLRYEADLVYGGRNNASYRKLFMDVLVKAVPKQGNHNRIQFVMEDKGLYMYIDNELKKGGRFSDRSFNSEVMEISIDDLAYVLDACLFPAEEKEVIIAQYKQKTQKDISFREILIEVMKGFANGIGNASGVTAWSFMTSNILNLIPLL